jgi:SpoVK/Ycf46/Vps4 family AAA+-type ATPase
MATLGAFSLKAKTWGEVRVDSLRPIQFRDDAFEKLVFPEKLKEIIKGLSEQQSQNTFTDILGDKGGGVVFLLHGVPGVGKSLTAEAVAEFLHKPLYMVDVGELGISPDILEKNLQNILALTQKWDAALLIDEADIFLQQRSTTNVLRNAMVGIFLRQLEYHNGVLFLTSNRVEEIDEAFRSRISLALHYRMLDKTSRVQVWANLLEAAEFKLQEPSALEHFDLNGRQIKTVIRLAISLAKYLKKDVSMEHIVHTTLLIQEFHENLARLMTRRPKKIAGANRRK